jgi:hypothetical protein
LHFTGFDAVETGDKFFEETGFHGRIGRRTEVW